MRGQLGLGGPGSGGKKGVLRMGVGRKAGKQPSVPTRPSRRGRAGLRGGPNPACLWMLSSKLHPSARPSPEPLGSERGNVREAKRKEGSQRGSITDSSFFITWCWLGGLVFPHLDTADAERVLKKRGTSAPSGDRRGPTGTKSCGGPGKEPW